tara:strand:- start:392 stop:985 length:594 start_codon:yes stop_codon:yes gene_type:complete
MTANNQQHIETISLQLDYDYLVVASRCNDVIEAAFESELAPIIEEVLTTIIPTELVVHIPSLEIDLGDLREEALLSDFKEKLRRLLSDALMSTLSNSPASSTKDMDSKEVQTDFLTAAIAQFLGKGFFPHWLQLPDSFETLLLKSLQAFPEATLAMLQKSVGEEKVIKRLTQHLSEEGLKEVFSVLQLPIPSKQNKI